jgi:transaldolase
MTEPSLATLGVKIFVDSAELDVVRRQATAPIVRGFTTNPTLMRRANVADYRAFAHEMLKIVGDRPVSFEVFADEFDEMERQALDIASWGPGVYVKIPVTNTRGESAIPLVRRLTQQRVQVNVTAILTEEKVREVAAALAVDVPAIVSVFAGRVADTGRDPVPLMARCHDLLSGHPRAELLWASSREVLNIFQADQAGCGIITITGDLLAKLTGIGRDLDALSLDTVQMFHRDAANAGYNL